MGGNSDIGQPDYVGSLLFLKFSIPDISQVTAITSFVINLSFYDNDDGGGESAEIDFAQPGANLVLADPAFTSLNHIEAGDPLTLTYSLTPAEIAQVMPNLEDGTFRIRIERDTGDYYVAGGSAEIDATLAPEPSTAMLGAGALLALTAWRRRSIR
jgi:MYXO-CTERM domain-containing protein